MPRVARKVAPVLARNSMEAAEQDLGKVGTATMPSTGPAKIEQETIVEPITGGSKKAEDLAFNEEKVTIRVHETTDKFAPKWVEVYVNGKPQLFWRGQETTCARKFVEALARCKPVSYRNEEYVDPEGSRSVRWPATVGLEYPFEVVADANPKGRDWLRRVLRQAM